MTFSFFLSFIGLTRYGDNILSFRPLPSTTPPPCSTFRCIAIDLSSEGTPLTSGKSYYFTLSATNKVGLTSFLTSNPYLYTSTTPTPGLVLDFDPKATVEIVSGSSYHLSDIDVLLEGSEFGVLWVGFAHPTAEISYSIGLGATPGLDDVISFTPVGSDVSSHVFRQVSLLEGSIYYATVVADTGFSRSNSSSNGVLVLQEWGRSLQLASVYDGPTDVDMEYQASSSHVSAQWFFPASLHASISHYMWGVVITDQGSGSSSDGGVSPDQASGSGSGAVSPDQVETVVRGYLHVGKATSGVTAVSERLRADGTVYRNAVRACFATRCLPTLYSDGFQIAQPPTPGGLNATYTPLQWDTVYATSTLGRLDLEWEEFADPQLAYYEWSLGTNEEGAELLVDWQMVEWFERQVSVPLNVTVSLHYPNVVTLRGYTSAGLHASTHTALLWNVGGVVMDQGSIPRDPLVVYDLPQSHNDPVVTGWEELVYEDTTLRDIDYITSSSSLSGAWPSLRYTQYHYSISTLQQYLPCTALDSLACGNTFYNSATATNLPLTEGSKYYFCVQALAENAIHRTPAAPPVLEVCSNGVTVDMSPPRGGCVKIIPHLANSVDVPGSGMGLELRDSPRPHQDRQCVTVNDTRFQVSTSDLYLIWEEFVDVESYGNTVHASAVASYSYGIGGLWVS